MAKATLAVELKGDRCIEVRISGKRCGSRTERFEYGTPDEANQAMVRAVAWATKFAETGQVPA